MFTLRPLSTRFKRLIEDYGAEWKIISGPFLVLTLQGGMGVTAHPVGNPHKVSNFRIDEVLGGARP